MHNIYIGWDAREDVAYQVCKHSIYRKAKGIDINVTALKHKELRKKGAFYRPWMTHGIDGNRYDMFDLKPFSTEFSHTRFLVPFLNNYKGWALFMDCDMIFTSNVKKLFDMVDNRYACMVVKHRYNPPEGIKMDDEPQTKYYRKNWSSFVLWNCAHPKNKYLTVEKVNSATGGSLHAFDWLEDKDIGSLPFDYNWIEGNSPKASDRLDWRPDVIHYTLGGPWFPEYQNVMYGELWTQEFERWQRACDNEFTNIPSTKYED
jgi:lipopolysaccharide biosynthesis glycosyltransferase